MKKVLVNVALLLTALLVAFGLAEIAVRLLKSETTVLFPRYHTDYRYGPYHLRGTRPGETFWHSSIDGRWKFVTNNKGFRDSRDFGYEKPADTYRVLSVGDSQTQGHEVRQEATFSAVLERYLNARGRKAEVLNVGVSGFSTAEELAFIENEGYRYHPDAIVLGFFGNDFEDNYKAALFELDDQGQLVATKFEHVPGVTIQKIIYAIPGMKWLGENSHLYSLVFNSVWLHFKFKLADQAAAPAGRPVAEYAVPTQLVPSAREIALAATLIERMKTFCDRHAIRLIFADLPFREGPYRFTSSLPAALRDRLHVAKIEIIDSNVLLQPYSEAVETHVTHGYQHISEFTHGLIGVEIGRRLLFDPQSQ